MQYISCSMCFSTIIPLQVSRKGNGCSLPVTTEARNCPMQDGIICTVWWSILKKGRWVYWCIWEKKTEDTQETQASSKREGDRMPSSETYCWSEWRKSTSQSMRSPYMLFVDIIVSKGGCQWASYVEEVSIETAWPPSLSFRASIYWWVKASTIRSIEEQQGWTPN